MSAASIGFVFPYHVASRARACVCCVGAMKVVLLSSGCDGESFFHYGVGLGYAALGRVCRQA